jgi:hypothetical protein
MPGYYLSSCHGYFEIVLQSSFTVINSFNVAAWVTDHVVKSWKKKRASFLIMYLRIVSLCPDLKIISVPASPCSLWCMVNNKLKNTSVTLSWMIQLKLWLLVAIATSILMTVACFGVHPPDYTASKLRRHQTLISVFGCG